MKVLIAKEWHAGVSEENPTTPVETLVNVHVCADRKALSKLIVKLKKKYKRKKVRIEENSAILYKKGSLSIRIETTKKKVLM